MKNISKNRFSKRFKNRISNIFIFAIAIVLVFGIRLLQLQVFGGQEYRKGAAEQRKKTVEIPPDRGVIFDRNKNPLVKSVKINTVYLFPENIENKDVLATFLSETLSMAKEDVYGKMDGKGITRLKEGISEEQVNKIKEAKYKGVSIAIETGRNYPYNQMAAFLLGFVNDENNGLYGVEKEYNLSLRGRPGVNILSQGLGGAPLPYEESTIYPPSQGNGIVLAMDEKIQGAVERIGEEAMKSTKAKKIAIIVSNPNNGEIIAMENFPRYDLNNPRAPRNPEEQKLISEMDKDQLLKHYFETWRSFAIEDVYEPGSVFKVITTAAALEEKTATDASRYTCTGFIKDIPGVVIKCHRWYHPHGVQNLQEALTNSCNPAFVQIVRDIGLEKFYKYIKGFGFGDITNIDLPGEQKGIIPTDINKIGQARFATMSYGHGIAVTPIQMITAANAAINGGFIVNPKVTLETVNGNGETVKKIETNVARQVISEKTSETLRGMLLKVVNDGGGSAIKIPGYNIGGKSGTSIKLVDGKYTSEKTVASFYGTFPAEKPEYTVLAIVDEPQGENGGNAVAGPIVRDIIQEVIKYKNFPVQYNPDVEIKNQNIVVPNLVGLTLKDASKNLIKLGLKSNIINTSTDETIIIKHQFPKAFAKVKKGEVIDITADDTGTAWPQMPNIIGKKMDDIVKDLEERKIKYTIEGDKGGKILQTDPEGGTLVDPSSKVKIILKDDKKKPAQNGQQTQNQNNASPPTQ